MHASLTLDPPPTSARPGGITPITDGSIDDALAVLGRGFPERPRAFWERGLDRLDDLRRDSSVEGGAPGYLLHEGDAAVGVLLTFRSGRTRPDGSRYPVVNLCAWYVDPEHRWKAPMMLRRVVGEAGTVFTDLTPSTALERINPVLGFEDWNEGEMIAPVAPWAALRFRGAAEVLAFEDLRGDGLRPEDRALLEGHAAMGCLAAVLCEAGRTSPLIFQIIRRRRFRVARLIYAESRRAVIAHRAAVARFLTRRGILVLSVDADRAECPRGTLFREGRRRFRKGGIDRDRLDYAYSEFVLLDLDQ